MLTRIMPVSTWGRFCIMRKAVAKAYACPDNASPPACQASPPSARQPPRDLLGGRDSPDAAATDAQAAARAQFGAGKADDGFYRWMGRPS